MQSLDEVAGCGRGRRGAGSADEHLTSFIRSRWESAPEDDPHAGDARTLDERARVSPGLGVGKCRMLLALARARSWLRDTTFC